MAYVKGRVYFMVSYLDDEGVVPAMETVVYLGEEKQGDDGLRHIFQDYESWRDLGAYPDNEEGAGKVFALPSHELSNILDYEAAIAQLSKCIPLRKSRGL